MAKPHKLVTHWFAHLKTKDEQSKFVETLLNHSTDIVLRRLYLILVNLLEDLERKETTEESYTNSAWPYKQAHINGQKETLRKILDLLNFVNVTK